MTRVARATVAGLLLACAPACVAEPPPAPTEPTPVELWVPRGFPPMVIPEENPTTVEGIALGRRLYHDRRLSPDGSRACADCHHQDEAFSSTRAIGILPHVNLAWSRNFLWDGSTEGTLEDAMRMEVEDFFETDVERLREPDLEAMFLAAFGSPEPTTERAALALAQYQRTLVSGSSRYDRHLAGEPGVLDEAELRGLELFFSERTECFHCHATILFTDNLFHNIGLDERVEGRGRVRVTGRALDAGAWKTPTLRNVARTAPYMHDDRYANLEEVVDHYAESVAYSSSLDSLLHAPGNGLTLEERADLVAFLGTLTDDRFLTDPALGPP